MTTIYAYVAYLFVSLGLTVWVARTLHRNGRVFLIDSFRGDELLADSVNHLLVVGFYLVNIGYATFTLQYGDPPKSTEHAITFLSTKLGLVMLVLGGIHFVNLFVFANMRRNSQLLHGDEDLSATRATSRLRDKIQGTRQGFESF